MSTKCPKLSRETVLHLTYRAELFPFTYTYTASAQKNPSCDLSETFFSKVGTFLTQIYKSKHNPSIHIGHCPYCPANLATHWIAYMKIDLVGLQVRILCQSSNIAHVAKMSKVSSSNSRYSTNDRRTCFSVCCSIIIRLDLRRTYQRNSKSE